MNLVHKAPVLPLLVKKIINIGYQGRQIIIKWMIHFTRISFGQIHVDEILFKVTQKGKKKKINIFYLYW